jgi:hypothetical protein
MGIYRGIGGTGDSTSDSNYAAVAAKAVEAATSATNAASSASSAASSASSAQGYANAASDDADAAASSATSAASSASAASTSATNAATSATNAAASATLAATYTPSQTGNAGKFLTTNGSTTSWATVSGGGGAGLSYQGTWNASTNSPTLASSTGTNGYYYIVGTAGSTNLDGITDWQIGDWLLFNGTNWQKLDQTNSVSSVAGRTGAVTLSTSDISGLGTIATQNANSVTVTGGTINGATVGATTAAAVTGTTVTATTKFVSSYFDASGSGGGSLRNASGTAQIQWGGGGGNNVTIDVSTNLNGSNAQIDISPTGTGHVHIKPTGSGSIEIAPTNVGTMDNMTIGATTARAITGTTITATTYAGGNVSNWNTAYGWGNHASAGYATNLDGLSDVAITTPTSGQVLKYNGTSWVNDTDATGSGGGVTTGKAIAMAIVFGG